MLPPDRDKRAIEQSINDANNNGRLNDKRIYIFGCTLNAGYIIECLLNNEKTAYGFIENDKTKVGTKCTNIMIYSPQSLLEDENPKIIIIASAKYSREMVGQLLGIGLCESEMLVVPLSSNQGLGDFDEEKIASNLEQVKNGIEIYEGLQKIYKSDAMMLFPYPGTGDIYVACGFLNAYLKKNKIVSPLLVVCKKNCKEIAALFGYEFIEIISQKEMNNILLAWQFLGAEKIGVKPLLFWGWNAKYYYRAYRRHKEISFSDMFKYDVFGLSKNEEFRHPKKYTDEEYISSLSTSYDIEKGKSIIIAPYAGSFISSITFDVWEEIAQRLKKKGYSVFTNCFGAEVPIKGTKAICFPYEKAVNVLEYAGGFIGIRSGLCDVISNADCKKMIVYESNYLASDYEFFSIVKMGLTSSAKEIEYISPDHFQRCIDDLFI